MFTISTQDFDGNWNTKSVENKQEAFDYITSLDMMNAVEIEGVEQADAIISPEELEAWMAA
jgi:hypothetical protein